MLENIDTIQKTQQRAEELLRQYGLKEKGWRFEFSRTKEIVGQCYHRRKVIEFSLYYIESSWEEIEDTLLHEVAHALVGPHVNHGPEWKAMAIRVGARPDRVTETAVSTAKHNYLLKCSGCGRQWRRHRLQRRHFGAKCGTCHSPLRVYRINYEYDTVGAKSEGNV
jgi:predicted SprT family Zn-dependent metalloprotease